MLPSQREDKGITIAKLKSGTECVSHQDSRKLFTFTSSSPKISEHEKIKV
jgi:hypothetical protein